MSLNQKHLKFPLPLIALLQVVADKFKGHANAEIKHCDVLNLHLELESEVERLSEPTIKRLYGIDKVKPTHSFRQTTTDILAQYMGYKNYLQFEREFYKKNPQLTQREPSVTAKSKKKIRKSDYNYHTALIDSSQKLDVTLEKILNNEVDYLSPSTRISEEQEYLYRINLYNFCSFFGNLTLVECTFADNMGSFPHLGSSIFDVRDALDKHPEVHYQQLMHLCILWKIETYWLEASTARTVGHDVEKVIEKYSIQHNVQTIDDILGKNPIQLNLLREVSNVLHRAIPYPINYISQKMLEDNADRAIQKLFQIQAWLFYAWQNGIAEFMIKKDDKRNNKRFTVIDFDTFEEVLLDRESPKHHWIRRVEAIFSDLDVHTPAKYDARIVQIQKLHKANKQLLKALKSINI